jgi:hypothetical protein
MMARPITVRSGRRTFRPVYAIALVACAGDGPGTGANDLDAAPLLAVEEMLRIGSTDDPDYGFTAINGVDVDRDGNVYVFEGSESAFRVYSPDGELLRRFGGRGEGPGEFRSAPRFGILGDTIWAIESFGRRISLFRLDGTVISTAPIQAVTIPLHTNVGLVMPVAMRSDGLFTSDMTMFSSSRDMELNVAENDTVLIPRVLFNAGGMPVDTVGWLPHPPPDGAAPERVEVGDNRYNVPRPASDQPLSITLPDGRIVIERPTAPSAEPANFVFTRLDLAGDTIVSRAYTYRPRPFDGAALDTKAWQSARRPGGGVRIIGGVPQPEPVPDDSIDAFNRIRGAMDFPAFQPPVQAHRVTSDGDIWLMREEDGGTTQRWTIIRADAALGGTVALDRGNFPIWMDIETFFLIERDEFDVQWLVRYRLQIE